MTLAQKRILSALTDRHCTAYKTERAVGKKAFHAAILAHLTAVHCVENCLFNPLALSIHTAVAEKYASAANSVAFSLQVETEINDLCEAYNQQLGLV